VWDDRLRKGIDPVLLPLARGLVRLGITANGLTVAGFGLGVATWIALALGAYPWALGFLILNRLLDGLDGLVARLTQPTDLGGFLDIVCDFLLYAGFPFFFALGQPDQALSASFLIFSFVGTGSSFLAFAAIAAKSGKDRLPKPAKAIHYLGGMTEGGETIAVFVAMCLWPEFFGIFAWIFGSLCCLTTLTRMAEGVRCFSRSAPGTER